MHHNHPLTDSIKRMPPNLAPEDSNFFKPDFKGWSKEQVEVFLHQYGQLEGEKPLDLSGWQKLDTMLLTSLNMRGWNLENAFLADTDLSGSDLTGASLKNAQMNANTLLSGTILHKSGIEQVMLNGANLSQAILFVKEELTPEAQMAAEDVSAAVQKLRNFRAYLGTIKREYYTIPYNEPATPQDQADTAIKRLPRNVRRPWINVPDSARARQTRILTWIGFIALPVALSPVYIHLTTIRGVHSLASDFIGGAVAGITGIGASLGFRLHGIYEGIVNIFNRQAKAEIADAKKLAKALSALTPTERQRIFSTLVDESKPEHYRAELLKQLIESV